MNLVDQSVLVMGMGRSGVAAAKYALAQGAKVVVTDLREDSPHIEGAYHSYGKHIRSEFMEADIVIASPGIPASAPDIQAVQPPKTPGA